MLRVCGKPFNVGTWVLKVCGDPLIVPVGTIKVHRLASQGMVVNTYR